MTTAKVIGRGTLTGTLANIDDAAVPESTIRYVKALTLCNTSTGTIDVTITFDGINVIYEYPLPGTDNGENTITIPFMDQVMGAAERIQGKASTTGVVDFYISGKEISTA